MARSFKSLALATAEAAALKKGEDITVLHVAKKSPLTDYLLIVTATARPHLKALEDAVSMCAHELGFRTLHRSKPQSDSWCVLDFGGLIVHLMTAPAREFFQLEKLHEGAPSVHKKEKKAAIAK
jgi:ribosome-associated protein